MHHRLPLCIRARLPPIQTTN